MNAAVKLVAAETVGELVAVPEPTTALAVLKDSEKFDAFYSRIKAETDAFVPDLTTDAGRKAIASMAFKVTKTKTAIDEARKALTEDARKQVAAANAAGKVIWEKLETLAADVRKPLTEWEEAEKKRVANCKRTEDQIASWATVTIDDSAETVADRLVDLKALAITEAAFGERFAIATALRGTAVASMTAAVARLTKEEADRAELAQLRAAEAERARLAEVAAEAARVKAEQEAAELAAAEAVKVEAERQAKAKADEAQRLAEAAEAARAETARLAQVALDEAEAGRLEAIADAETARQEAAQREADAAAKAQRDRDKAAADHAAEVARIKKEADERETARLAEVAAQKRADDARAADRAHRSAVMGEAKAALMEHAKLDEETAKVVVLAISGGNVPHVSISF